jgi:hypothetical protein
MRTYFFRKRANDWSVDWVAGAGCVEINDVNPRRSRNSERQRNGNRIVPVNRLIGIVALAETNTTPTSDINSRIQLHG